MWTGRNSEAVLQASFQPWQDSVILYSGKTVRIFALLTWPVTVVWKHQLFHKRGKTSPLVWCSQFLWINLIWEKGGISCSPHPRSCPQGKIVFPLKKKNHISLGEDHELIMRAAYKNEFFLKGFTRYLDLLWRQPAIWLAHQTQPAFVETR